MGFTASPEERDLVDQIFAQEDPQGTGILTGSVAVERFKKTDLSSEVLCEIWQIADEGDKGYLTRPEVAVLLRLIIHSLSGATKLDKSNLARLPKNATAILPRLVLQLTGASKLASPSPSLPRLTPQDSNRFKTTFRSRPLVNDLLHCDQVLAMLRESQVPDVQLAQICKLCDTQKRQALDSTEFTMAMWLTQAIMNKTLSFVPTSLPPGLYEQASGGLFPQATGSSAHFASPTSLGFPSQLPKQVQPQSTGSVYNVPPALPSRRQDAPTTQVAAMFPFAPAYPPVVPWDVTSAEKAIFDKHFDELDTHKVGYVRDIAVEFMLRSGLSEDDLAQIWDLADIDNNGRLTRDDFAVAMHLIHRKMEGKDIPTALPPTLVPPSRRPPPAAPPPFPAPIRDLLWDPTAPLFTQPQTATQPQLTGTRAPGFAPPPPSFPPPSSQDPFSTSVSAVVKDLLGDDDDVQPSPPLQDRSAEVGNVQNQLNSTNKALQTTQAERESLETTLASQAAQLSSLQTQLASAKVSFETETSLLNTLRQRHATQSAEIQKVREELIRAESDLSAVRVEKAELEGQFLREKEEVRELNRKMVEVSTQIAGMQQEVEKVKKLAEQQKGLLAVTREQFATKEVEKANAEQELEEAQTELADAVKEREEAEANVKRVASPPLERATSPSDPLSIAMAQPLPLTPDMTGAASTKNNNFEKLAKSSATSTPRSQSPFGSFPSGTVSASPHPAVVTSRNNPFAIKRSPEVDQRQSSEVAPDNDSAKGEVTPRAQATSLDDVFASPTNDESFATPDAGTPVRTTSPSTAIPSLDVAAAHFPALDGIPEAASSKITETWTDLHDLDIDEPDSDSDSGEEDKEVAVQDRDPPTTGVVPEVKEVTPAIAPTFPDDIFSVDAGPATKPESAPPSNIPPVVDAFGAPLIKASDTVKGAQGVTSGFNDAFGGAPASGSAQPPLSSSFDGFDDDFAFPTSASTSAPPTLNGTATKLTTNGLPDLFPLPTTASPPVVSSTAPSHQNATSVSFDSAFSGPWATSQEVQPPQKPDAGQRGTTNITFEEAFGGVDASQALKLDAAFPEPQPPSATVSTAPPPPSRASKPFPTVSPPASPRGGPSPSSIPSVRSASPQSSPSGVPVGQATSLHQRAASPSPRVASPPTQRPSTSSSKEDGPGKPAIPPRPSKRSLRFPFSMKKKQEPAPPAHPSNLGQKASTLGGRGRTQGSGDDVESVRRLSEMGFKRAEAVAALEKHGYDFQKALDSLLGTR